MNAIRDPIHNWIRFSDDEKALIDTPLVQRLRWVRQLGVVHLVYPGGNHTRFEHSIGAMHLAGKYIKRLLKTVDLPEAARIAQLTRAAALLHDIGHGPFSHSFDRAVYSKIYDSEAHGHDFHRHYIIHSSSEIRTALERLKLTPSDISWVWLASEDDATTLKVQEITGGLDEKRVEDWLCEVIHAITQGPLGADRIDFTLRDSYYTGTAHFGTIGATRIIDSARIDSRRLTYNFKVIDDIVNALRGRKHMYASVYMHKASLAASYLVEEFLEQATEPLRLVSRTKNLEEFLYLTDSILSESSRFPSARALLRRELPKLDRCNDDSPTIVRKIIGINVDSFDKYRIGIADAGQSMSFSEALSKAGYEPDIPTVLSYRISETHSTMKS